MRSGFLNVSPSESPIVNMDKGARNKRKFRTDQQQHPGAAPLPAPPCALNGGNSKNGVLLDDACSSFSTDPQSNSFPESGAASPSALGCCNTAQSLIPSDLVDFSNSHPCQASANVSPYSAQSPEFPATFQHFRYPKDGHSYAELQQDSDWDRFSEAELEAILLSMLDGLYKNAIKKILSFSFTHEEALNAILRKGRWNKRDALTSIVESALAWLQNSEARNSTSDLVFSDLKEMESYVLAEMVSMLRKVRPYLSKGEAMWCLLICDLNVLLACTMDEESASISDKEGSAQSVGSIPLKKPTEQSTLSALPNSTTVVHPQQVQCLSQTTVQPSSISISSHKESRSAFSTPSFSSSSIGKVAVASRKGASSKSSVSINAQKAIPLPTIEAKNAQKFVNSLNMDSLNPTQGEAHQTLGSARSVQRALDPHLPVSPEENATKLGLYIPNSVRQHTEGCSNVKPDYSIKRTTASDASPSFCQETQLSVTSVQCMPQHSDVFVKNVNPEQLTAFQPVTTCNKLKGSKMHYSNTVILDDNRQPVPTDLQIGSSGTGSSYQVPQAEGSMASGTPHNVGNVALCGASLSLVTVSARSSERTDFLLDSQVDNCTDESDVSCSKAGISVGQMLGCTDPNAEDRKTVMLWQLVDRVKYLEAQLQNWTDWAQQKVMQAARRLTKDTAELKALRQERDEYVRLKKEKQALEESTMKRLAEMETSLSKALSQVDRANSTALRLESENAQVRAEMEAAKLTAAESVYVCQEATKREKKSIKKAQGWENQKIKLQEELIEGKRNLSVLLEQLGQARERLQQTEARWKQEIKLKNEAQNAAEIEKRAKEAAEHSAKKREEALQRKSEGLLHRYREEVQKLESDIAKTRMSMGLQPSMLSWGSSYKMVSNNLDMCSAEKLKLMNARLISEIADLRKSQKDIHRDRECVLCMSEEMSVIFLPCAHQVVCAKCSEFHQKQGLVDCPSCRTPIHQRIRVYGVRP